MIRAVVKTAVGEFGMKCIGIEDSFEGILGEPHVNVLALNRQLDRLSAKPVQ